MSSGILDMLLLQSLLKPSGGTDQLDSALKWIEEFRKNEKENAAKAKAKGPQPAPKIFSVPDVFFILTGLGLPVGLAWAMGVLYLFNQVRDMLQAIH
jgi:hypothetical protein